MTSKLVVLEERFGESELHWNVLSLSFSPENLSLQTMYLQPWNAILAA
jgi:hypothetical protein